jgi:hypothetical protein
MEVELLYQTEKCVSCGCEREGSFFGYLGGVPLVYCDRHLDVLIRFLEGGVGAYLRGGVRRVGAREDLCGFYEEVVGLARGRGVYLPKVAR